MGQYTTGWSAWTEGVTGGELPAFPNTIRRPMMASADGTRVGAGVLSVDEAGGGTAWLHRPAAQVVDIDAPLLLGRVEGEGVVCVLDAPIAGAVLEVTAAAGPAYTFSFAGQTVEVGAVSWTETVVT